MTQDELGYVAGTVTALAMDNDYDALSMELSMLSRDDLAGVTTRLATRLAGEMAF